MRLWLLAVVLAAPCCAELITKLTAETEKAFEAYIASTEPKLLEQARAVRALPWLGDAAKPKVRSGEMVVRGYTGDNGRPAPNGMIHDWAGGVFIPKTSAKAVAALLQDFARHREWYPEIVESKLHSADEQTARGSWTMRKKNVITVVLRAELESRMEPVAPNHFVLLSRSEPIVEVTDFGSSKQGQYPTREGHGFLWRFNGYWNLHQAEGGVYAECRVISLSRDVPSGLGWIVNPFIQSMPRESLESTLRNTMAAVSKR